MSIEDAKNLFQESALLQLTATSWQTTKKLPKYYLEQLGNSDYLKGRKVLLPKEDTEMINQIIGKARNYLRRLALPFPIRGVVLIPRDLIPTVQTELETIKWSFDSAVYDFIANYETTVQDARDNLGELYDEQDYPSKNSVEKKFKFEWRYLTVGPSTTRILPPSLYQKEVRKFQELMEQARIEAIEALREEFTGLISNITDKLNGAEDGKRKVIRNSAVENINSFLDTFSLRNIFADNELDNLVKQCREIISGVTPEAIRTNVNVKNELHVKMNDLKTAIESQLTDLPRRKLRLAA